MFTSNLKRVLVKANNTVTTKDMEKCTGKTKINQREEATMYKDQNHRENEVETSQKKAMDWLTQEEIEEKDRLQKERELEQILESSTDRMMQQQEKYKNPWENFNVEELELDELIEIEKEIEYSTREWKSLTKIPAKGRKKKKEVTTMGQDDSKYISFHVPGNGEILSQVISHSRTQSSVFYSTFQC